MEPIEMGLIGITLIGAVYAIAGIRIVRPTRRAIIERLGHYKRIKNQGVTWIAPGFDKMYQINITEQMAEAGKQEVITQDNLNAMVDVQVYYKVMDTEKAIMASQYNVNDYRVQIVALARTTLRNVIGNNSFEKVNSERAPLNNAIKETIAKETEAWGIDIVRCELKEIEPPRDVQETMNKVLKAKNEKTAAVDFATATETQADGVKRAAIKEAEGRKQAAILTAEGQSQAIVKVAEANAQQIKLVNEAAQQYFKAEAKELKRLEVTQAALENNMKVVITEKGISPSIILGEFGKEIVPVPRRMPV